MNKKQHPFSVNNATHTITISPVALQHVSQQAGTFIAVTVFSADLFTWSWRCFTRTANGCSK